MKIREIILSIMFGSIGVLIGKSVIVSHELKLEKYYHQCYEKEVKRQSRKYVNAKLLLRDHTEAMCDYRQHVKNCYKYKMEKHKAFPCQRELINIMPEKRY